jgi:hypothetical protein
VCSLLSPKRRASRLQSRSARLCTDRSQHPPGRPLVWRCGENSAACSLAVHKCAKRACTRCIPLTHPPSNTANGELAQGEPAASHVAAPFAVESRAILLQCDPHLAAACISPLAAPRPLGMSSVRALPPSPHDSAPRPSDSTADIAADRANETQIACTPPSALFSMVRARVGLRLLSA